MTICKKCGISMPTNVKWCRDCRPEMTLYTGIIPPEFINIHENIWQITNKDQLHVALKAVEEWFVEWLDK